MSVDVKAWMGYTCFPSSYHLNCVPVTDSASEDAELSAKAEVSENMLTNTEKEHQGQFLVLRVQRPQFFGIL